MALGDYSKTTYVNNTAPAISASNLNNIENKVAELDTSASGLSVTKADLNSPAFTGTPTTPSASAATDTTQVASTAFVHDAIALDTDYLTDFRAWDTTRSYGLNDPVFYNGVPYKSLVVSNSGYTPDVNADKWEVTGGGGNATNAGYTLDNGDFEANVTGWTTYDNGASIVPTSGYGGSPSYVSISRVTTDPLVGVGSMLFTKGAGDGQGEGVASPFTIDLGVRQNPAEVSLEVETSVSGYADGDLGLFLYDITNGILVYPSITAIPATYAKPSTFKVVFSPNSTSGSYRLIFHVTSTNASAWTAKIDNIQIGQKGVATGAVISEWRSYTPTFSAGFGTVTSLNVRWRRVGSSIEFDGSFVAGVTTTGQGTFTLPTGSTVSRTLVQGRWRRSQATANTPKSGTFLAISGDTFVYFTSDAEIPALPPNSAPNVNSIIAAGETIYFELSVPISQWTSNVNLTEDFTEYAYNTGTSANTDDLSSFGYGIEGSQFQAYTLPSVPAFAGTLTRRCRFKRPIQPTDKIDLEIYVGNGWLPAAMQSTFFSPLGSSAGITSQGVGAGLQLAPGTTDVDVIFGVAGRSYGYNSSTVLGWSPIANSSNYKWRVRKVSNGNMAEIPPTVRAEYNTPDAAAANTNINFSNKVEDTHNAVTVGAGAWKFTVPVTGVYQINTCLRANSAVDIYLHKNNTQFKFINFLSSADAYCVGGLSVRLNVGDYIHFETPNTTTFLVNAVSYVDIVRIGS